MRSHNPRDTSERSADADLRADLKADIDWLLGFPMPLDDGSIGWQRLPTLGGAPTAPIPLDAELIARTRRGVLKAINRFPRALPRMVGDVTAWKSRIEASLDLIEESLASPDRLLEAPPFHEFAPLQAALRGAPASPRAKPTLASAVAAARWCRLHDANFGDALLQFIAQYSDHLAVLAAHMPKSEATPTLFALAQLTIADGDDTWRWLIALFGDPRTYTTPILLRQPGDPVESWPEFIAEVSKYREPSMHLDSQNPRGAELRALIHECFILNIPFRPFHTLRNELSPFIDDALADGPTPRKLAAELVATIFDATFLDHWEAVWRDIDDLFRSLSHWHPGLHDDPSNPVRFRRRRSPFDPYVTVIPEEDRKIFIHRLKHNLTFDYEPPTALQQRAAKVLPYPRDIPAQTAKALARLLRAIPRTLAVKEHGMVAAEGFVERLALLHRVMTSGKALTPKYLNAAATYFERHGTGRRALDPWPTVTHGPLPFQDVPPDKLEMCFDLLASILENGSTFNSTEVSRAVALANTDIGRAQRQLRTLFETGTYTCHSDDSCAFLSACTLEEQPGTLPQILKALESFPHRFVTDEPFHRELCELDRQLKSSGSPGLVLRVLLRGEHMLLGDIVTRFMTMHAFKRACKPPHMLKAATEPAWINAWPPALRGLLSRLAVIHPKAEARAKGLLRDKYPSLGQLEREIAGIKMRLETAPHPEHLRKRLATLEQRKAALSNDLSVPPSAITALESAIDQAILEDYITHIDRAIHEVIAAPKDLDAFRAKFRTRRTSALMFGIYRLESPYREYAIKLLQRAWGGTPWDLCSEPPNRDFIARMAAKGLRWEPWLNPGPPIPMTGKDGATYWLALEDDDIEQLLMGYHFQTCLSPEDMNFFSAVTNAVDVNKRMISLRNAKGQMVARCLLAIGDNGRIVTFRPYSNTEGLRLDRWFAIFTARLAHAMGTLVSSDDHVSPLMTTGWYEDFYYELGAAITASHSAVRKVLASTTPSEVLRALEALPGVNPTHELVLSQILELPELRQRPHLIEGLLPAITRVERRLPPRVLLNVAVLAFRANLHDEGARLCKRHATKVTWHQCAKMATLDDCSETDHAQAVIPALIRYHPSALARILREGRPPDIARDIDEIDPLRRETLAKVMSALGRTRQAAALGYAPEAPSVAPQTPRDASS